MGSLADQIKANEDRSKVLDGIISKAAADAEAAKKESDAIAPILEDLRRAGERVATGKTKLDGSVAAADEKIAAAATGISALRALVDTKKAGLSVELDKLVPAKLTNPPGPLPAGASAREKLPDYDDAVKTAAEDLTKKATDVEAARVAKASALLALGAAETAAGSARQDLDASVAALKTALSEIDTPLRLKDPSAAGEVQFRLAQQKAWVESRKQAVQSAITAMESAADTFASKEKDLEDAMVALAAAASLLSQERALQANARDAVAAELVDAVKKA